MHNVEFGIAKRHISALNVMAMRVQRHSNVSKQATLFDGLDVSSLKWHVCGCGLNPFVHEGMNRILNVEVYLKTRGGNVNISKCQLTRFYFVNIKTNMVAQIEAMTHLMKHEPRHEISNNVVCATSKGSDQSARMLVA